MNMNKIEWAAWLKMAVTGIEHMRVKYPVFYRLPLLSIAGRLAWVGLVPEFNPGVNDNRKHKPGDNFRLV